jgi:nitrite reductase/ring-hydroxylating ferredoxin subunit
VDCNCKPDTLVSDDADRDGTAEHRLTGRRSFLKFAVALPVAFGASVGASGSEHQYPIPAGDGVTIDRKTQVIVVRYQQHLYAFNLACPHENTALKWLPKDGRFQCPKHESRYQPSGQFIDGRATRHMDRLGVRVEDNMLVVDVNKFYRSDKDAAGWAAATVAI